MWANLTRRQYLYALLFIAVIGISRYQVLRQVNTHSIYSSELSPDEIAYQRFSNKIVDGTYKSSVFRFSPTPAFIYSWFGAGSPDTTQNIRLLNFIVGLLSCALIFAITLLITKEYFLAMSAMALAGLYKPLALYNATYLKTSLVVLFSALCIFLFLLFIKASSQKLKYCYLIAVGLVFALLLSSREQALLFLPGYLLAIWFLSAAKKKQKILYICCFLASFTTGISFYLHHNYQASQQFILTTTQSGYNFYLAQRTNDIDPYFRPVSFAELHPDKLPFHFHVEALRRNKHILQPQELNDYWIKEAFVEVSKRPLIFVKKTLLKVLSAVSNFEYEDNYNTYFHAQMFPSIPYFVLNFSTLLALALVGLFFNWRRNKDLQLFTGLYLLYSISFVVFFFSARYRLPIVIFLFPMAAIGLKQCYSSFRVFDIKPLFSAISIIALTFVITNLSFPGHNDYSAFNNMYALKLIKKNRIREATAFLNKSESGYYKDYASLILASNAMKAKKLEEARNHLNTIKDGSYASSAKFNFLANYYLQKQNIELAIENFEKSLTYNNANMLSRAGLLKLYQRTNNPKLLEFTKEHKLILSLR